MRTQRTKSQWWSSVAVAAALMLGAGAVTACGDDRQETEDTAEERAEVDRQMDLAMEGDTGEAELRDEARDEPVRDVPPATGPERRPRETAPPVQRRQPPAEQPARAETEPAEEPAAEEAPAEEPAAEETRTVTAPAGSTMRVVLDQELSTKDSQVGDLFTARVVQPVSGGEDDRYVVIPKEATVRGRVTGVQESGGQGERAVIQLAVTEITVGAETYPLAASVVQANPETRGRASTGEKAAKIGAGAAAGAILGRVIGGNAKGTAVGAAAGAAAGTAIALGTEDVDAVLPAGSEMTLQLDKPFTIQLPAL